MSCPSATPAKALVLSADDHPELVAVLDRHADFVISHEGEPHLVRVSRRVPAGQMHVVDLAKLDPRAVLDTPKPEEAIMTDTATIPDGITQLDHRCWELTNRNGEPVELLDGVPHYANDTEAKTAAAHHEADMGPLTPVQLDTPCWKATARCGTEADDVAGHHPTMECALQDAFAADWTVHDGALCCADHGKACAPDTAPN